jgi:hypothetical protein
MDAWVLGHLVVLDAGEVVAVATRGSEGVDATRS